jgi:hypothetical protein
MELSYEEQEAILLRVFTGTDYAVLRKDTEDIMVLFKYPSNSIKMISTTKYNHTYNRALKDGMLSISDLDKMIRERGMFTEEDDKEIASLESKLYAQQVVLSKTTKVLANQERLKKIISDLTDKINKIRSKKNITFILSADMKAEEERNLYLCWSCSYNMDKTLLWNTYDEFKLDTSKFREEVIGKFLVFYRGVDTETIRFLARSNLWRIRYITSQKTAETLFGIPTIDYSNDMVNLAYWSNFYQNVYEMMPEDRPTDIIIEDDESLDAYMKEYYDEKNREMAEAQSRKRTGGNMSAFDNEEVIVTKSHALYHDIKYTKPKEAMKEKGKANVVKRTGSR